MAAKKSVKKYFFLLQHSFHSRMTSMKHQEICQSPNMRITGFAVMLSTTKLSLHAVKI